MSGSLLEAHDVRAHIRGVQAVNGVDLALRRGEILGLIGPNGAGKTTLVNTFCVRRDHLRTTPRPCDATGC